MRYIQSLINEKIRLPHLHTEEGETGRNIATAPTGPLKKRHGDRKYTMPHSFQLPYICKDNNNKIYNKNVRLKNIL